MSASPGTSVRPFAAATRLRCAACDASPPASEPYPARCRHAGEGDADHLLARDLDPGHARFEHAGSRQPFVRFRELLHSWARARTGGMSDGAFVLLAEALDAAVARTDRGFVATPCTDSAAVAAALGMSGGVWLKDETGNVSGSHKARHLFGLLLHLEVAEAIGLTTRAESDRRGLAIASCGNAALAAATVAHAAGRPLRVFIPGDAHPRVVERLNALGAHVQVCVRAAGIAGDPCVHAFRAAVAGGALPFCVQGNENGLAIEGGMTLGWELAADFAAAGVAPGRLFVQVGGGALASGVAQALHEARTMGVIATLPALHAVQTRGCFPLRRAYVRVRADALARIGVSHALSLEDESMDAVLAARLAKLDARLAVREAMANAREHRSRYMWPWEHVPHSVAHGILDDETYDWAAIVEAMLETGGWPVVVDEPLLLEARALAQGPGGLAADATGAAALAGLVALRRAHRVAAGETVAVLVTGAER